jgi:uncharacterized membrane protein YeaQ/YmgE (transglycosylase-associated protein family)
VTRPGDLRAGLVTTLTLVFLGAPVGLIWHALAPHPEYSVSGGHAALLHPESAVFVADDAYLLFIGAAVGLLCGLAAWLLARRSGPGAVVGLTIGGLGGSFVAGAVGAAAARADLPSLLAAHVGSPILAPYLFGVHATAVQLAWPLVAVLTFGIVVAARRPDGNDVARVSSVRPATR